ncbi:homoserine dehydrogenase [Arboricoccus pini]|uniref:Homoserine dehydrogenase n=1 Tax=Arboricoccus pini TaxID=1963835 RepID=A0A212QUT0_9PROT|nr:homoserine dehydrogenase [Arboricoccus pini]SNB63423.1 homoserine dehydrogenase [Arboricoccus pini]
MSDFLRIGVAGLGTVGAGTVRLLQDNAALIRARTGRRLQVVAVSARDRRRDRGLDLSGIAWHDDPVALAANPDVDVICELIGGADGPALDLTLAALEGGKPVVTANKAMLALHGERLAGLAERRGAALCFEAAVAGGIPVIKALREGLAANRIERVYGILNGTSNYILSTMQETGREFADVLSEAQALGYAEADPSFDVDGIDAAHKLALLAALAYGVAPRFDQIHIEGIRHVSALDIALADELGYRIKLLGTVRYTEAGLEQRLHPAMVRKDAPIAEVDGVFNAVVIEGDRVGSVMLQGRGAGAGPTASAVTADLIDIARGIRFPVFGVPASDLLTVTSAPLSTHRGSYYIRLMVVDRPGVLADVAAALRDHDVSIESLIQRSRDPGNIVPIVLTSHEVSEAAMQGALDLIANSASVIEPPRMIRIEPY